MMAQKYPDLYNGILAAAPAINWDKFLPGMHWPYVVMKEIGEPEFDLPESQHLSLLITNG